MSPTWRHKRDQRVIKANCVYQRVTVRLMAALILQEERGAKVFAGQHGRSLPHRGRDH